MAVVSVLAAVIRTKTEDNLYRCGCGRNDMNLLRTKDSGAEANLSRTENR